MKEVSFSAASIISSIEEFSQQNITELYLHDKKCIEDRQMLEKLIGKVKSCCPDLFLSLPVSPKVIDHGFVKLLELKFLVLMLVLLRSINQVKAIDLL